MPSKKGKLIKGGENTLKTLKVTDEVYNKIKDIVEKEQSKDKDIKNLQDLVGQIYTFWCARYIYHGKVKEVNSTYITLEDAGIVYETGEFAAAAPSDMQSLPHDCQIVWGAVESFIKLKW